jgi:mono/diheme cytochrome c family protein
MRNELMKIFVSIGASALLLVSTRGVAADVDYGKQVAPIFKKYCVGCHNPNDKEGELVLDRYQSAMKGGEEGTVIVPGKSGESRMILALTGKAEPRMPPEDELQPTAEEIALLTAWIDAGAKGPADEPSPLMLTTPKIAAKAIVRTPISALSYSSQGNLLAIARYREIELRSTAAGAASRSLTEHIGRVNALTFSTDGALLAAAAGETGLTGEARLWDVASGKLIHTFAGHRDSLYAIAISPSGKLLATAGYDQQIKLWEIESGKELRTLIGTTTRFLTWPSGRMARCWPVPAEIVR